MKFQLNINTFLGFKLSDDVFIKLINVNMTIAEPQWHFNTYEHDNRDQAGPEF